MNRKLGMYASLVTLAAVLCFALSMLISFDNGSYFSSMFIAWGFVPMICAFTAYSKKEVKAAAYTAMAFAAIYGVLIAVVYFAQLTTVRMSDLTGQAAELLDYSRFNLFFSYDLLGYAFMALSTFFIALTLDVKTKSDKWLKGLLMVHGIFAVSCFIMPMLGIFKPDMPGGDLTGTIVLEFWCAYFTPVCILSCRYFKKQKKV